MAKIVKNAFQTLAFLDLNCVEEHGENVCSATAELNIGRIETENAVYLVGFKRADLHLVTEGFEAKPETRYAIYEKPAQAATKEVSIKTTKNNGKVKGAIKGVLKFGGDPSGAADAAAEASRTIEEERTLRIERDLRTPRVRARGVGLWELFEPEGDAIDSCMIDNKALLKLTRMPNRNRQGLCATISVSHRDMWFRKESDKTIGSLIPSVTAKEKIVSILAAKALSEGAQIEFEYRGSITLSRVDLSDD